MADYVCSECKKETRWIGPYGRCWYCHSKEQQDVPAQSVQIDPKAFNPAEDSTGFVLFEQYETETSPNMEPSLLLVSSTTYDMNLSPGDFIIKRRWAPAGVPEVFNHAKSTRVS